MINLHVYNITYFHLPNTTHSYIYISHVRHASDVSVCMFDLRFVNQTYEFVSTICDISGTRKSNMICSDTRRWTSCHTWSYANCLIIQRLCDVSGTRQSTSCHAWFTNKSKKNPSSPMYPWDIVDGVDYEVMYLIYGFVIQGMMIYIWFTYDLHIHKTLQSRSVCHRTFSLSDILKSALYRSIPI